MRGSFLGPSYSNEEIETFLRSKEALYERLHDNQLFDRVAGELAQGKVVGWFQGPMEFGPRALGGRSILGDARDPKMQSVMNLKIKFRECSDRSLLRYCANESRITLHSIPTARTCC